VRRLRGQPTDAERALWRLIRGGQIAGAKFRRQHEFGPYVLDFYCPERRLVVEADGGRHFEVGQQAADAERTRYLRAQRLRVLRFTNTEILREPESVLQVLLEAVGTPSP
jgi:very-short-patch-repair endonuclease